MGWASEQNKNTKMRRRFVEYPASIGINSLGTAPRLTFQARLLHNQEGVPMPKRAVFERSRRELSLDISVGVHILLVVEQSSLGSQSRG